jgi:hypothetical protein
MNPAAIPEASKSLILKDKLWRAIAAAASIAVMHLPSCKPKKT